MEGDRVPALLLVIGVFLGSALWWLVLSGTVSLLRSKLTPGRFRWVNWISGSILGGFGFVALGGVARCFARMESGDRPGWKHWAARCVVRAAFGVTLQAVIAPVAAKAVNMRWGMPIEQGGFLLWLGDGSGSANQEP